MTYYWSKKNPYFKMAAKEDRIAVLEEFEQKPLVAATSKGHVADPRWSRMNT